MNPKLPFLIILLLWTQNDVCPSEKSASSKHKHCCGANKDAILVKKNEQNLVKGEENIERDCKSVEHKTESKYSQEQNEELGNNFVLIRGGTFSIGTDEPFIPQDGEGPARKVHLDDFYINEFEVSNQDFSLFVKETQFITEVMLFFRITYLSFKRLNLYLNNFIVQNGQFQILMYFSNKQHLLNFMPHTGHQSLSISHRAP